MLKNKKSSDISLLWNSWFLFKPSKIQSLNNTLPLLQNYQLPWQVQRKVGGSGREGKNEREREREPPLFPIPLNSLFPFLLYSTTYNTTLFLAFRWWGWCKEKWAWNDSKDSFLLLFFKALSILHQSRLSKCLWQASISTPTMQAT